MGAEIVSKAFGGYVEWLLATGLVNMEVIGAFTECRCVRCSGDKREFCGR